MMRVELLMLAATMGVLCMSTAGAQQVAPLEAKFAVDREPVYGRNLPYSPAEGETVKLNPPPFRWLPSGEVTYRLQVAREAGFEGE